MKSKHIDRQRLGLAITGLMRAALPPASIAQEAIRDISAQLDLNIFGSAR